MKGKKIRIITIISATFIVGLLAVITSLMIKPTYADVNQQNSNVLNSDTLDDVTNLEWVENSSATLSWTEVTGANYYHITVTVYENDGTNASFTGIKTRFLPSGYVEWGLPLYSADTTSDWT